jgi:hypothetical protein
VIKLNGVEYTPYEFNNKFRDTFISLNGVVGKVVNFASGNVRMLQWINRDTMKELDIAASPVLSYQAMPPKGWTAELDGFNNVTAVAYLCHRPYRQHSDGCTKARLTFTMHRVLPLSLTAVWDSNSSLIASAFLHRFPSIEEAIDSLLYTPILDNVPLSPSVTIDSYGWISIFEDIRVGTFDLKTGKFKSECAPTMEEEFMEILQEENLYGQLL